MSSVGSDSSVVRMFFGGSYEINAMGLTSSACLVRIALGVVCQAVFLVSGCFGQSDSAKLVIAAVNDFESQASLDADGQQVFRTEGAEDVVVESRVKIRRERDRSFISLANITRRSGAKPWCIQNDFEILENGNVLGAQSNLTDTFEQLPFGEGSREMLTLWSKEIAGHQALTRENVLFKMAESSVLVWWVGRVPLSLYLKEASKVVEEPLDDGAVRISGVSPYGDIELIASARSGWLPRWFRVTKGAESRCVEGTVASWFMPEIEEEDEGVLPDGAPEGGDKVPRPPVIASVTWECNVKKFSKDGTGRFYPASLDVRRSCEFSGSPDESIETKFDIGFADFSLDHDDVELKTALRFPNGFHVVVADAEHLPFKWDGSAVIPGVPSVRSDTLVLASADDSSSMLWRLVLINVVLLVCVSIGFAYRRRLFGQP